MIFLLRSSSLRDGSSLLLIFFVECICRRTRLDGTEGTMHCSQGQAVSQYEVCALQRRRRVAETEGDGGDTSECLHDILTGSATSIHRGNSWRVDLPSAQAPLRPSVGSRAAIGITFTQLVCGAIATHHLQVYDRLAATHTGLAPAIGLVGLPCAARNMPACRRKRLKTSEWIGSEV